MAVPETAKGQRAESTATATFRATGEVTGMAERLAVDGDELERFMKMLNKSTDSLKGVRKALSEATVTGLGTDDLDSACEGFQADWKYGSEEIGKQTEDLAEIIGKSRDSYREVDKALEEALKKTGDGSGGGKK
ncbi:hypothetical protein ACLVWQ_28855 [Streptomyces sp. CWNU-52B]|uniref:hypothetical protein n=1 Tax=unclassified Streptomyces TaxID=2593676 RepID=UPI0039C4639C